MPTLFCCGASEQAPQGHRRSQWLAAGPKDSLYIMIHEMNSGYPTCGGAMFMPNKHYSDSLLVQLAHKAHIKHVRGAAPRSGWLAGSDGWWLMAFSLTAAAMRHPQRPWCSSISSKNQLIVPRQITEKQDSPWTVVSGICIVLERDRPSGFSSE